MTLSASRIAIGESSAVKPKHPSTRRRPPWPTARRHVSFWSPLRVSVACDIAGQGLASSIPFRADCFGSADELAHVPHLGPESGMTSALPAPGSTVARWLFLHSTAAAGGDLTAGRFV